MPVIPAPLFNLAATLESGQIFRWRILPDGWYWLTVGSRILRVRQQGFSLEYECSDPSFDVASFFDLSNKGYKSMLASFGNEPLLADAVLAYAGLRIIRQEPWECTASFICSSLSNIGRIRQNLNSLAQAYGEPLQWQGYHTYAFPKPQAISRWPSRLKDCRLGYREAYLAAASRMISQKKDFSFEQIRSLPYEAAKMQLMRLPGVGPKVADCILLFSLGFSQAFPVDVWIERMLRRFPGQKQRSLKELAQFGRRRFGSQAGYAQQFLYHYARSSLK